MERPSTTVPGLEKPTTRLGPRSAVPDKPLQPGGADRGERLRPRGKPGDEIVSRDPCLLYHLGRVAVAHLMFGELVLVKDPDSTVTT